MLRLFKKRKKTSWSSRKFYSQQLANVLIQPQLDGIKKGYLLTYTESTEKNLADIISYINSSRYFRLSTIANRVRRVMDDFGERPDYVDRCDIYLLIGKDESYYIAVVTSIHTSKDYKLSFIKSVHPFCYKFYFSKRQLIYPI
jgi:hypothetical protein